MTAERVRIDAMPEGEEKRAAIGQLEANEVAFSHLATAVLELKGKAEEAKKRRRSLDRLEFARASAWHAIDQMPDGDAKEQAILTALRAQEEMEGDLVSPEPPVGGGMQAPKKKDHSRLDKRFGQEPWVSPHIQRDYEDEPGIPAGEYQPYINSKGLLHTRQTLPRLTLTLVMEGDATFLPWDDPGDPESGEPGLMAAKKASPDTSRGAHKKSRVICR